MTKKLKKINKISYVNKSAQIFFEKWVSSILAPILVSDRNMYFKKEEELFL